MNQRSQIYINLTGLTFLSIVFGIVFMVGHTREIIGIITSYIQLDQRSYLNLSNIAYCLVGVVHILLPIAIIYPHKSAFEKKSMLKVVCYIMAGIYVVANVWVIQWLLQSIFTLSISFDVAQYLKVENMMFNHMQWVSRNAETIFYNHIAAIIWFLMGYNIDRDRKLTCKLLLAQMALCYLVPVVAYYIYRGNTIPDWWMKKTIPLICSDALLLIALWYMATNREAWARYISPLRKGAHSRKKSQHHSHHHSDGHSHHSHHHHSHHHHSSHSNTEKQEATDLQGVDDVKTEVEIEEATELSSQDAQQEDSKE